MNTPAHSNTPRGRPRVAGCAGARPGRRAPPQPRLAAAAGDPAARSALRAGAAPEPPIPARRRDRRPCPTHTHRERHGLEPERDRETARRGRLPARVPAATLSDERHHDHARDGETSGCRQGGCDHGGERNERQRTQREIQPVHAAGPVARRKAVPEEQHDGRGDLTGEGRAPRGRASRATSVTAEDEHHELAHSTTTALGPCGTRPPAMPSTRRGRRWRRRCPRSACGRGAARSGRT